MEDSYGNFIIQKLLYQVDNQQKVLLLDEIRRLIPLLQKKNVQRKWSSIVDEHSYSQTSSNLEKDSDSKEYEIGNNISYNQQQQHTTHSVQKERKSNLKKGSKSKGQMLSFQESKESKQQITPNVEIKKHNPNFSNISTSTGYAHNNMLNNIGMLNAVSYQPYPYNSTPYNTFNQRTPTPVFPSNVYPSYYQYPQQNYGLMPNPFCYDNSISNNIYYQKDLSSTIHYPQQQGYDYSSQQLNNIYMPQDRLPKGNK